MEEAQHLIKTIKQMEGSLDDEKENGRYDLDDGDLQITFPLNRCITVLNEKYAAISKLHRERFEQVKSTSHFIR
jgi:protein regulator of cytokinesis 1